MRSARNERKNAMRAVTATNTCTLLMMSSILVGCGHPAASSRAADEKALRDLVDRTVAAAERRDMAAYARYYAPKATLAVPGRPIFEMASPTKIQLPAGYAIKMVTVKTEVSDGGDLGYALGTYEQTAPDKSGALINTVGKWVGVFKKQPDGSWGAVVDTFNVDPPN
jgi:ketosteroid isomerase-like protein